MSKAKAIELDGEFIYMQIDEDLEIEPLVATDGGSFEEKGDKLSPVVNNLAGILKTVVKTTLGSVKEVTSAEVDKITLEFSVKLSSEAGFVVASGKAEGALKISVDLKFPPANETTV